MQKIEKWRIHQLAMSIGRIADLLKRGGDLEWANVFLHYRLEINAFLTSETPNMNALKQMVDNIRNCYSGVQSFISLTLSRRETDKGEDLNKDFMRERALLYEIILGLDEKFVEYTH